MSQRVPSHIAGVCSLLWALLCPAAFASAPQAETFDLLLLNGTVIDGSGSPGRVADVGVRGDRVVALGELDDQAAREVVDACGLVVAPGFINMLSWATESLLVDGLAQSDIRQGVTLEVFGEGTSMGPLGPALREEMLERQGDLRFPITWESFGGYLETLERRGVAPNVASFVGATNVRINVVGYADRKATAAEIGQMQAMVRTAMEEGALGVGSSLIYAPAFFADTDELVALALAAAPYGGRYISHLRSEGNRLLESVQELITIAERAGVGAEIYHLKAAGKDNWGKLDDVIRLVEAARARGLDISANMYTYTAGATGLEAAMPPWVQEGGHAQWVARLRDPAIRSRVAREMRTPSEAWENLLLGAGPEGTLLSGFRNPALKPLAGRRLSDVAGERGKTAEETAIDLVIQDDSRVETIYFLMSEENVRRQLALPWMSFGSDGAAPSTSGVFLQRRPHPRTYGNVARLLGHYVREEKILPLEEAIRRLSAMPAEHLRLRERGRLAPGYHADIVVFDPATIRDNASYEDPHRYASGVREVFVNGVA
ncbi:MAG: N-acyl-D-amino-acid deacylase family protein, partial [Gammaproteobacteria bacterium]